MSRKETEWLFETCRMYEMVLCIAWRACFYLRETIRRNRDAVDRFNAFFDKSTYPFPVDPFVTQCLWLATKIETQLYDTSTFVSVAIEHKKKLDDKCACSGIELRNVEFAIAIATDWRLMPSSPFFCLADWKILPSIESLAINLIEKATIEKTIWQSSESEECVAAAAVVAAECSMADGATDAFRSVRSMVACSVAKSVDIFDVLRLARALEVMYTRAIPSPITRRSKRKMDSATQSSPSSVVPENETRNATTYPRRHRVAPSKF